MPTADRSDDQGTTPSSDADDLEKALGAAAKAGAQEDAGDDIAADDAGGSKLALEVDRERKLPSGDWPGKGEG